MERCRLGGLIVGMHVQYVWYVTQMCSNEPILVHIYELMHGEMQVRRVDSRYVHMYVCWVAMCS